VTSQVKQAKNQSQIFNRKSISRNSTHRQSSHLIPTAGYRPVATRPVDKF